MNNYNYYGDYNFSEEVRLYPLRSNEIDEETINNAVNEAVNSVDIKLSNDNSLKYQLLVNNVNKGTINIPKDQFLKNVDYNKETHIMTFHFEKEDGEESVDINIDELVDNVPTVVSAFTNDAGYLTEHQSLDAYVTKEELEDKGYITEIPEVDLSDYATISALEEKVDSSKLDNFVTNETFVADKATLISISSKLMALEDKISALKKSNIEVVTLDAEAESYNINNATADIVISEDISKSLTSTATSTTLKDITVSNDARLNIKGDVDMKDVTYTGSFPNANGKNAVNSINNSEDIVFKNVTFKDYANLYNAIEIGLSSTTYPKSILIDNCKWEGDGKVHVAIAIFGTADNAVVNINNCHIKDCVGVLRLANVPNTHCTINFTNCRFDNYGYAADINQEGFIVCQDHYSPTAAEAMERNVFGSDKITINIINCYGRDGKKITDEAGMESICGGANEDQLILSYYNKVGRFFRYANEPERFPTMNIM